MSSEILIISKPISSLTTTTTTHESKVKTITPITDLDETKKYLINSHYIFKSKKSSF